VFVSHVVSLRLDALNDHTFDVKITSSYVSYGTVVNGSEVCYHCMVGLVRHGKIIERSRNGWPSSHVVERISNGWPSTPVMY
jgi:hypothetical protein